MGPGFAVFLGACLAGVAAQRGHPGRGPPGPPPPFGPPPGHPPPYGPPPGPPPGTPTGGSICCQTVGNPCCQNGQAQTQAQQTTPGPWSGYTLSPAATGGFRGNASYFPANWTAPSNVSALPPIGMPNASVLLPNGTVRFPNGTLLLTRYPSGASPPAARLPSGLLMLPDGSVVDLASAPTTLPPPGFPLNATTDAPSYPPLRLPPATAVFHNGSLALPGGTRVDTVFARGFVYDCVGVTCHHAG